MTLENDECLDSLLNMHGLGFWVFSGIETNVQGEKWRAQNPKLERKQQSVGYLHVKNKEKLG